MKIVLVGPGLMPIPPTGWGATEILIWDYYLHLKDRNHDVHIVNQSNANLMIQEINNLNPDIVHIHYDDYIFIVPHLNCKQIIYTTHWAYLTREDILTRGGYFNIFKKAIEMKDRIHLFSLSSEISKVYIKYGFPENKIKVMHNGANDTAFRYDEKCKFPNKSVYLAKIDERKSQYKYQSLEFIDFVGNKSTTKFDYNLKNYLGEWNKDKLYQNLTDYANLVLLSDGEAHPLVVCEALICGLGVVVSTYASANLDTNLEWITVIPDHKLNDLEFVKNKIIENQKISVANRQKIREYGLKKFSWKNRIDDYITNIEKLVDNPVKKW
jgi:glycosyltransferase involved in cell wall biosynthesis